MVGFPSERGRRIVGSLGVGMTDSGRSGVGAIGGGLK